MPDVIQAIRSPLNCDACPSLTIVLTSGKGTVSNVPVLRCIEDVVIVCEKAHLRSIECSLPIRICPVFPGTFRTRASLVEFVGKLHVGVLWWQPANGQRRENTATRDGYRNGYAAAGAGAGFYGASYNGHSELSEAYNALEC